MRVTRCFIPDNSLLMPRVFGDAHSFFMAGFNRRSFDAAQQILAASLFLESGS